MNLKLQIPDMACSACRDTITAVIQALDPSAKVDADLETKMLAIQSSAPAPAIREAIQRAGYTVRDL